MSSKPRNVTKYVIKEGNKIKHGGITTDPERREQEHQQTWPRSHLVKVGRQTTEEAARRWEKEKGYS